MFLPDEPVIFQGTASDTYSGVAHVEVWIFDGSAVTVDTRSDPPAISTIRMSKDLACGAQASPCGGTPNEATWSYDASDLPAGAYSLVAVAIDRHGNLSGPQRTAVRFVRLAAAAPQPPTVH